MCDGLNDQLPESELERKANALLDSFVPLAFNLPKWRDDPEMMHYEVKALGAGGAKDVATQADKRMQAAVKKAVLAIDPKLIFKGEEAEDKIDLTQFVVGEAAVADPVEGTNNFIARMDEDWGSVLAIVDLENQEPLIGIVAVPMQRKVYLGIKGLGAWVIQYGENNQEISRKPMEQEPERNEFTYNNSPHFEAPRQQQIDRFWAMGRAEENADQDHANMRLRKPVTIAYDGQLMRFVDRESGALEAVQSLGTIYFKTDDEMAAVAVILKELGGMVTDGEGRPWHPGFSSMICARTPEIWAVLKAIYDQTK